MSIIHFDTVKIFSVVFKNTCGTVLIFLSAHSVFLTAENLQGNATYNDVMCCVFQKKNFQLHLNLKPRFNYS